MRWQERCPICGQMKVYTEHMARLDIWRVFCVHCGYSTGWYNSHDKARAEWDDQIGDQDGKEMP